MNSKTLQDRLARLMPAGVPRYVRCYEDRSDPGSFDRYTVVYTGRAAKSTISAYGYEYPYVGLSGHGATKHQPCDTMKHRPGKPAGYQWPPALGRKCHLGTRIPFAELPDGLKRTVLEDYREIWRLDPKNATLNPASTP